MTSEILLHTCCAPCASSCIERLLDNQRKITLFFSNSNLDTADEFEKRLAEVRKLAKIHRLPLIVDTYDHDLWLARIAGRENEPERGRRCPICFSFSFERASQEAAGLGMNFTTSLTVSPHKNSDIIRTEGAVFGNFEFFNFKKQNGFARSLELSRQYSLYRQCYCGCEFSRRDAGLQ